MKLLTYSLISGQKKSEESNIINIGPISPVIGHNPSNPSPGYTPDPAESSVLTTILYGLSSLFGSFLRV